MVLRGWHVHDDEICHNFRYDRQKLTLKDIANCMFVSCMNPTAGSFTIDPRLQRHFCTFAVRFVFITDMTTRQIFTPISSVLYFQVCIGLVQFPRHGRVLPHLQADPLSALGQSGEQVHPASPTIRRAVGQLRVGSPLQTSFYIPAHCDQVPLHIQFEGSVQYIPGKVV